MAVGARRISGSESYYMVSIGEHGLRVALEGRVNARGCVVLCKHSLGGATRYSSVVTFIISIGIVRGVFPLAMGVASDIA
jgi:hypothetical protein